MNYGVSGRYVIGTGYHQEGLHSHEFLRSIWMPNTQRYASPERIVITNAGAPPLPEMPGVQYIDLTRNPQHGRRLEDPVKFAGWSLGFIHGALYAYSCGLDYIYKEQDCLAFGDWVKRMYQRQRKTGSGVLTGELVDFPTPELQLEMCLVFVAYDYIMPLLEKLFAIDLTEKDIWPEGKFAMARDDEPAAFAWLGYGYGGNRPFDETDDCFYIQKPRWNTETKQLIKTEVGSLVPTDELERLPL